MSKPSPNVLVLTVDALRADRMSTYGYERPTTPSIDHLSNSSIVCNNAMTLGPFTQSACIQLFTSSKPLSYGGYDAGAFGRPDTLFKHFHNAGYSTWGLSTIHWVSPYYGYTEGLDIEHSLFHLNTLVGMAVVNMRDTLFVFCAGGIEADEMLERVTPVIERMFENIQTYCTVTTHNMPHLKRDFPAAKISNDEYDFEAVRKVVDKHQKDFRQNPMRYITNELTMLTRAPDAHEWIAGGWYYKRSPLKLVCEFLTRLSNKAIWLISPDTANKKAASIRLAVDAHAIADKVIDALRNYNHQKPFFIWAHFKDTHRPYVSGPGHRWYDYTPDYLEQLGYPRTLDPTLSYRKHYPATDQEAKTLSALYDAAICSTDAAIGRIIDAAKNLDLFDDTVIGIAGDHGEEIGDHGDFGHECMAYEHNSRVPMIFKPANSGTSMRLDSLVSSLDFAPTLGALAGIGSVNDWEGADVRSDTVQKREHIVLETFCRGNCLFKHRPLYLGVRTNQYKYLICEYIDPHHKRGSKKPELYDLIADPSEQHNIYQPGHPALSTLNRIIADRLNEIPELDAARIEKFIHPEAYTQQNA